MTDSTALDREQRLLAALAQAPADERVTDHAVLVDERGVRSCRDSPAAGVLGLRVDGLSTVTVTERVILVVYRLLAADGATAAYCSTVWQLDPGGWVAVLHQRSPSLAHDAR